MLSKNMSVLEFGCGGSTLFFSKRVSHVTSVENNKDWFCKILELSENKKNITMVYSRDGKHLFENILKGKFDCILIDSGKNFIRRKTILKKCISILTGPKIIVIDNYNSVKLYPGFRKEKDFGMSGFKQKTFNDRQWKGSGTKILYKG